jgi:hypothetical protein
MQSVLIYCLEHGGTTGGLITRVTIGRTDLFIQIALARYPRTTTRNVAG